MYKKISIALFLSFLMSLTISTVVLADVPDPYGRPRPIHRAEQFSFGFTAIAYKNNYTADKLAIEYEYYAPKMSDISYQVVDQSGNTIANGSEFSPEGKGILKVIMPKPVVEQKQFVTVKTKCQLNNKATSFGYKKTDSPIFEDYIDFSYNLVREKQGYVEIYDI